MNLSRLIASVEKKYKKRLEDFLTDLFSNITLSSHGIDHHQRAWSFGKELLRQSDRDSIITDRFFAEKLIIACYLHDSGMSIDPGPSHGAQSRAICEQFLRNYKLPENELIEVLDVIENHDNKEYSFSDQPGELLTFLSVADDLDAFGFIGIFRYIEIYLTRLKPIGDIGHLIIENATNRYKNFVRSFSFDQTLIEKHNRRYKIIVSFFDDYNRQCSDYQFGTLNPSGFCGVVEIIQYSVKHGLAQDGLFSYSNEFSDDKVIKWYFTRLKNELTLTTNH